MAAVAWIVYTIAVALPITSYAKIPFVWALAGQLQSSAIMALTSIPVWLIVVRWMHGVNWLWKLGVHFCVAPLYVSLNYLLYYYSITISTGGAATPSIERVSQWILLTYGIIYVLQFAVYHGIEATRQLRHKERTVMELLALSREQELSALKSQINPHFFFNTLNSISAMASVDVDETRSMIVQLADLLRYTIDSSRRDLVLLREELEFTKAYLNLESKRLSDRLTVEYNVAEKDLDSLIPPMVIQPLVENAIKHGIEPSETGGKISLSISTNGNQMSVSVRDTGVGFQGTKIAASGNGIGLKNTDARLRKLFGETSGLWTNTPAEGGFEVGFTLPLRRQDE